ncbi:hypothetical protein BDZ45DRAFT_725633 [Acephala macrosclerotiorum]|nr:hypothetical protein BDZ45DRAFT_725633 [Acephala macrosclerotiorum]
MAHYFWTQNSLPNDTELHLGSKYYGLKPTVVPEVELDLIKQELDSTKAMLLRWKVVAVFLGAMVMLLMSALLFGGIYHYPFVLGEDATAEELYELGLTEDCAQLEYTWSGCEFQILKHAASAVSVPSRLRRIHSRCYMPFESYFLVFHHMH